MDSTNQWVVVLAGGEGTRLGTLTQALYGEPRPKQFAVIAGERSMLQLTIERAARLVPLEHVLVVVSAHHEAIARAQLAAYAEVELVVQPHGLDTGPGVLLPLARLRARDPSSRVILMPSDHHVADTSPLYDALATSLTRALRDRVTLVGVHPDEPEIEYGWIVRGRRLGDRRARPAYEVRAFREKPSEELAQRLHARGGLWNTFISAGPVATYWTLARRHLPHHARALEAYATHIGAHDERAALADAYAAMTPANFSRDLLSRARDLAVVPVFGSGWCDWGSPRRVFDSLRGTPQLDALLARIGPPWARSDANATGSRDPARGDAPFALSRAI